MLTITNPGFRRPESYIVWEREAFFKKEKNVDRKLAIKFNMDLN